MTTPIERASKALTAPVHAPTEDHSPVDGSCTSCPWPLHHVEGPEGIVRAAFESITEQDIMEALSAAQEDVQQTILNNLRASLRGETPDPDAVYRVEAQHILAHLLKEN